MRHIGERLSHPLKGYGDAFFTRRTLGAACALTILFVALLCAEGRPAWGKTGLGFWSPAWNPSTSQHFLDPYSLSHVLHGIIFYWLLRPFSGRAGLSSRFVAALVLEVAWELVENSPWVIERYRQETAAFDYTGDTILNALGDLAAAAVGFAVASRVSWKVSVALFVALELWMLWLARDNFTLNVLMLLYPIEAVKDWQLSGIVPPG